MKNKTLSAKSTISISLYWLINVIFILKYALRLNEWVAAGAIGLYTMGLFFFIRYLLQKEKHSVSGNPIGQYLPFGLGLYTIVAAGLSFMFLKEDTFNVDRWDIIRTFWSACFDGQYPFGAQAATTLNTPAQSPFYFVLCLPFYLIKWYVGIPLTAIWIWWGVSRKAFSKSTNTTTLLLLLSVFFNYEVLTKSTILFNAVVVFAWCLTLRHLNEKGAFYIITHGLITGLFLSTRNAFALPFLILGLVLLRNSIKQYQQKQIVIWGISAGISFVLTFLPFMFGWGWDEWCRVNPFMVQRDCILPVWLMIVLMIGGLLTGLFCKNYEDGMFASGIGLFLSAVFSLIYIAIEHSWTSMFIDSKGDITYLLFGVPFLLYHIRTKE